MTNLLPGYEEPYVPFQASTYVAYRQSHLYKASPLSHRCKI